MSYLKSIKQLTRPLPRRDERGSWLIYYPYNIYYCVYLTCPENHVDWRYSFFFFSSWPLTQAPFCSSPIISQALPCHSRWEPLKEVLSEGWVGVLSQTLGRINKPGNIKRPFPLHLWTCALNCVNTRWDSLFWHCVKLSNASRKTADLPQIICAGVVWIKRNYKKLLLNLNCMCLFGVCVGE